MAEKAFFGMDTLYVSNGNDADTHFNTGIVDIAGAHSGIEPFYAPFTCIVREIRDNDSEGRTVVFQSTEPVYTPMTPNYPIYISMRLTHINDLSVIKDILGKPISKGTIFPAGTKIYEEGTSGTAFGNHIHIEFAMGMYNKLVYFNNEKGVLVGSMETELLEGPSQLRIDQALFLKYGQKVKVSESRNKPQDFYTYTLEGGEKATAIFLATHGTNPGLRD